MPKIDLIDISTAKPAGQTDLSRVPVPGEMITINVDMAKGRKTYQVHAVRHFAVNRRNVDAECQVTEIK